MKNSQVGDGFFKKSKSKKLTHNPTSSNNYDDNTLRVKTMHSDPRALNNPDIKMSNLSYNMSFETWKYGDVPTTAVNIGKFCSIARSVVRHDDTLY